MTKYLALFLCLISLAIAARLLIMPLSPDILAIMSPGEIANTLFARRIGVWVFALLSLCMFLGFYWDLKSGK